MSPELMTDYLDAARRAGAQSIGLVLPDGARLSAVFQPELPPMPPETPVVPGGWKTLEQAAPSLDAPFDLGDEGDE